MIYELQEKNYLTNACLYVMLIAYFCFTLFSPEFNQQHSTFISIASIFMIFTGVFFMSLNLIKYYVVHNVSSFLNRETRIKKINSNPDAYVTELKGIWPFSWIPFVIHQETLVLSPLVCDIDTAEHIVALYNIMEVKTSLNAT